MTSQPKRPQAALSKVLVEGFPDPGEFEGVPRVRKIAPESSEPRMKDKVVIVTGTSFPHSHTYCLHSLRNGTNTYIRSQLDPRNRPSDMSPVRSEWGESYLHVRLCGQFPCAS